MYKLLEVKSKLNNVLLPEKNMYSINRLILTNLKKNVLLTK